MNPIWIIIGILTAVFGVITTAGKWIITKVFGEEVAALLFQPYTLPLLYILILVGLVIILLISGMVKR